MDPTKIFLPVSALVGLTLVVLSLIPFRRIAAVRRGVVRAEDFKYGESASVPPDVSLPNRNLMNLLEMPILFYVACIILYLIKSVNGVDLWLCWSYVAFRVLHSLVHLTYNKTQHRLVPFALSNVILAAFWLRLAAKLVHRIYGPVV
jgi:hypothetical protein